MRRKALLKPRNFHSLILNVNIYNLIMLNVFNEDVLIHLPLFNFKSISHIYIFLESAYLINSLINIYSSLDFNWVIYKQIPFVFFTFIFIRFALLFSLYYYMEIMMFLIYFNLRVDGYLLIRTNRHLYLVPTLRNITSSSL